MSQVAFFVHNKLVAIGEMPTRVPHPRTPEVLTNTVMYCPACGDIWGRVVVKPQQDFAICTRYCEGHGSGLFMRGTGKLWESFPEEVLRRELKLIAKHYERNPDLDWFDLVHNWKRFYD